jgi:hypothetical protein
VANMNEKRVQRLTAVAAPLLQPGEQIEWCSFAQVGSVSVARRVATTVLAGVLTGGALIMTVKPRPFFLALTDRRLLFFGQSIWSMSRPEKKLAMEIPRRALRASEPESARLSMKVPVEVSGQEKGLLFTFARLMRDDAPGFAARLAAGVPQQ